MLKEKIVKDRMLALKEKNMIKRTALSSLLGELDNKSKNPTDAEVVSTIKKMIENNKTINCENENVYLEPYLPSMLSNVDLELHISGFIAKLKTEGEVSMRNMKDVMNYLSSNFPGQYDGKQASIIAKNLLV